MARISADYLNFHVLYWGYLSPLIESVQSFFSFDKFEALARTTKFVQRLSVLTPDKFLDLLFKDASTESGISLREMVFSIQLSCGFDDSFLEEMNEPTCQKRLAKLKKESKEKGLNVRETTKARLRLNIMLINTDPEKIPAPKVYLFYKLRWQIELFFKSRKSSGWHIDKIAEMIHQILCKISRLFSCRHVLCRRKYRTNYLELFELFSCKTEPL